MNRNNNVEFVRSKACRDCSSRIYYNISGHEWCDDAALKIRHRCDKWKPRTEDRTIDLINDLRADFTREMTLLRREILDTRKAIRNE
jgi:hypothetical protein